MRGGTDTGEPSADFLSSCRMRYGPGSDGRAVFGRSAPAWGGIVERGGETSGPNEKLGRDGPLSEVGRSHLRF
jgi:hypothetical protein